MLSIGSNVSALRMLNQLNKITNDIDHTSRVISTGKRILSASDDPAGIAIATRMKTQIGGYEVVKKNIGSGQSLLGVMNAGLSSGVSILQEMKKLALEAKNDTLSTDQRSALQETFSELQKQYDETIEGSTIFGKNLLINGAADINIQSGINAGSVTTLRAVDSSSTTLGVDAGTLNLNNIANADLAIDGIDDAISTLGTNQAVLGAQSRGLETRLNVVDTMNENLSESLSRIEDANIAEETAKLQLLQAQQQMALQTLQIAMQYPQAALSLLR